MMGSLLSIPAIIGFYMLISLLMLLFNVLYIFMQRRFDTKHERRTNLWIQAIEPQLQAVLAVPHGHVSHSHRKMLSKNLRRIPELMGYHSAMQRMAQQYKAEGIQVYLTECRPSFKRLASGYALRRDIEKASFAFMLSEFPPRSGGTDTSDEMLLPYLMETNFFCRENALRALYALGDAMTVERAFEILARQNIFHHEILLADGLMNFSGNKVALAGQLWKHVLDWPEHMGAAVIEFIGFCGADYRQTLYEAMRKPVMGLQVRLSILHYFYMHPFEPMRPLLLEYLAQADHAVELAIGSASALAAFPGPESIDALKTALSSRNWSVRNNAALSLLALGAESYDLDEVLQGKDPFAMDMLCYHVQSQGEEGQFPQCAKRGTKQE